MRTTRSDHNQVTSAAVAGEVRSLRIGHREVEGCDLIHVDEQGLIDELYGMIRPLSGLTALAEAMKRQLSEAAREAQADQLLPDRPPEPAAVGRVRPAV